MASTAYHHRQQRHPHPYEQPQQHDSHSSLDSLEAAEAAAAAASRGDRIVDIDGNATFEPALLRGPHLRSPSPSKQQHGSMRERERGSSPTRRDLNPTRRESASASSSTGAARTSIPRPSSPPSTPTAAAPAPASPPKKKTPVPTYVWSGGRAGIVRATDTVPAAGLPSSAVRSGAAVRRSSPSPPVSATRRPVSPASASSPTRGASTTPRPVVRSGPVPAPSAAGPTGSRSSNGSTASTSSSTRGRAMNQQQQQPPSASPRRGASPSKRSTSPPPPPPADAAPAPRPIDARASMGSTNIISAELNAALSLSTSAHDVLADDRQPAPASPREREPVHSSSPQALADIHYPSIDSDEPLTRRGRAPPPAIDTKAANASTAPLSLQSPTSNELVDWTGAQFGDNETLSIGDFLGRVHRHGETTGQWFLSRDTVHQLLSSGQANGTVDQPVGRAQIMALVATLTSASTAAAAPATPTTPGMVMGPVVTPTRSFGIPFAPRAATTPTLSRPSPPVFGLTRQASLRSTTTPTTAAPVIAEGILSSSPVLDPDELPVGDPALHEDPSGDPTSAHDLASASTGGAAAWLPVDAALPPHRSHHHGHSRSASPSPANSRSHSPSPRYSPRARTLLRTPLADVQSRYSLPSLFGASPASRAGRLWRTRGAAAAAALAAEPASTSTSRDDNAALIDELTVQLDAKEDELQRLRERANRIQDGANAHLGVIEMHEAKLRELSDANAALRADLAKASRVTAERVADAEAHRASAEKANDDNMKLTAQVAALRRTAEELRACLDEALQREGAAAADRDALAMKLRDTIAHAAELEAEIEEARVRERNAHAELVHVNTALASAEAAHAAAEARATEANEAAAVAESRAVAAAMALERTVASMEATGPRRADEADEDTAPPTVKPAAHRTVPLDPTTTASTTPAPLRSPSPAQHPQSLAAELGRVRSPSPPRRRVQTMETASQTAESALPGANDVMTRLRHSVQQYRRQSLGSGGPLPAGMAVQTDLTAPDVDALVESATVYRADVSAFSQENLELHEALMVAEAARPRRQESMAAAAGVQDEAASPSSPLPPAPAPSVPREDSFVQRYLHTYFGLDLNLKSLDARFHVAVAAVGRYVHYAVVAQLLVLGLVFLVAELFSDPDSSSSPPVALHSPSASSVDAALRPYRVSSPHWLLATAAEWLGVYEAAPGFIG
ncbi:hypothetical protein H9P43_009861 [Blastocladiella emersonii ATCC 22665]|nr:hypothetical protein H9P43_009861 [Blastocladiella emersonii ATCC 22665]